MGYLLAEGTPSARKREAFHFPCVAGGLTFAAHNMCSSSLVSQNEGEEVGSYGKARRSDGDGGVKCYLNIAVFTLHLLLEAIQELLVMQTCISGSLSGLQVFISPVEL